MLKPKPPLFIVPKEKPFPKKIERQEARRHHMTLVSALVGREGVVFFCDTQETLGGYAKKNVDKMAVWEFDDLPFRFAISGATDDATYLDMLERAITANILRVDSYSLPVIEKVIADTLLEFYAKHIWPQSTKAPLMEFLMVFQPLPSGVPDVIHVSGTAVNVPSLTAHHKSIGIGAYLAEYLFAQLLEGGQTQAELTIAAAYVGRQVETNVDGCGPVNRIVLLDNDGQYKELGAGQINDSLRIMEPFPGTIEAAFSAATSISDMNAHDLALEQISGELSDIRESNRAWWDSIQDSIKQIAEYRGKYEPKRKSSPFL